MQGFTCQSCRAISRSRFHSQLARLRDARRRLQSSSTSTQDFIPQSWYWDTEAPNYQNLKAASEFFKVHRPFREWTGTGWRRHKASVPGGLLVPEVVFLGRSNVGKSSLINHLTYTSELNRVSSTPGATKTMWAWSLAAKDTFSGGALKGWGGDTSPKLTLVDMPGYGFGSESEWGEEIIAYMKNRVELRRAFVVLDALQGVTKRDRHTLDLLRSLTIPYQIVISKCDKSGWHGSQQSVESALLPIREEAELARNKHPGLGELILIGSTHGSPSSASSFSDGKIRPFGISNLQWSILRATGLDQYAMQHENKDAKKSAYSAGTMVESFQRRNESSDLPSTAPITKPDLSLNELLANLLGSSVGSKSSPSPSTSRGRNRQGTQNEASTYEKWKPPFARASEPVPLNPREQQLLTMLQPNRNKGFEQNWPPFQQAARARVQQEASRAQSRVDEVPQARNNTLASGPNNSVHLLRRQPDYDMPSAFSSHTNGSSVPTQHEAGESLPHSLESSPRPPAQQAPGPTTAAPAAKSNSLDGGGRGGAVKGVTRGIGALEDLFDEPVRKQTNGGGKKKKNKTSSAESSQPPPPQPRAPLTKGVSRGMDALESMFADEPAGKKKKRR